MELLTSHKDCLILEMWTSIEETLRNNDRGSRSITCRTALQLGHWVMNHRRVSDLLQGVFLLELRIWIPGRVFMRDSTDLGEVFSLCAIPKYSVRIEACKNNWDGELLHVLSASVRKVLGISWTFVLAKLVLHQLGCELHRAGPVRPAALDRSRLHLLKANDHDTVCSTRSYQRSRHVKAG